MITTTEHLQLIKAECERLLAIAEKRTQGEWTRDPQEDSAWTSDYEFQIAHCQSKPGCGMLHDREQRRGNATYIAACAGRAEAGWRATIAGCEECLDHLKHGLTCTLLTEQILAAWPIELLTTKPQ